MFMPVPGPVGPAIQMDGYTTEIRSEPVEALMHAEKFSITCWVKVDAYPWNNLPILDQRDAGQSIFFGLNAEGHLLARFAPERTQRLFMSEEDVPLRRWTLVTMVVDKNRTVKFFLNGSAATTREWPAEAATTDPIGETTAEDILIGHVRKPLLPAPAKMIHPLLPISYSLQGSLGGLTIYGRVLTLSDVNRIFASADRRMLVETPPPHFPRANNSPGSFGAFYTTLHYEPMWDAARRIGADSDVVVRFPQSAIQLIFWQGNNYVPAWVTENNRWYTDEFMEVYGHPRCPDGEDCEPMSDKQSRYSHVNILESTPARAVIHWRYALSEVEYYKIADASSPTAWGDWADEYWTVYPDGTAIRRQVLWSTSPEREQTEFQETIVLIPAGETPEQNINYDALTFADLKGNTSTYSWQPKSVLGFAKPRGPQQISEPSDAVIQWVNLKSAWKPFQVAWGSPVKFEAYNSEQSISAFEWWNHWPVAQIPSSGRPALAADRPGHTSLSHIYWPIYEQNARYISRILMDGLTTLPARDLTEMAASWRTPAKGDVDSGIPIHYDATQRAYLLTLAAPKMTRITLHGSQSSPIVDPAFVVSGWRRNAQVSVSGTDTHGSEAAIGYVKTLEGENLIVFLPITSQSDVTVTISPGI
jgi:hypothetical protein